MLTGSWSSLVKSIRSVCAVPPHYSGAAYKKLCSAKSLEVKLRTASSVCSALSIYCCTFSGLYSLWTLISRFEGSCFSMLS